MAVSMLGGLGHAASSAARQPHTPHTPHQPKPRQPKPPTPPDGPPRATDPTLANRLFSTATTIQLSGRGHAVSWSPDGSEIVLGGHFADRSTGLRYDARVYDVTTGELSRTYACHYYWVTATAWVDNPFLGPMLLSGGADHAVRIWNPAAAGSTRCQPGQFPAADGARKLLPNINGWSMALAISPDGRYLAGASRDRMVRVWQLAPGPQQWRVVLAWFDRDAGNILSVAWAADGKALFTGDRRGRIARWEVDPDGGRWSNDVIAEFASTGWDRVLSWVGDYRDLVTRAATWMDGEHGQVWNVRVSPDGNGVAAAGGDGTVSVFDATTGELRWRHVGRSGSSFQGLDWNPNGDLIAAGSSDGSIVLLDATDGTPRDRLIGHADDVAAVAWSPDGQRLASTAGGPRLSLALQAMVSGPDTTARIWTRR